MITAVFDGRLALRHGDGWVDVATASGGLFDDDPMAVFARWDDLLSWADGLAAGSDLPQAGGTPGPVVPAPGQVFGIGLNYRLHALEAGLPVPSIPLVFTKFPSCVTGPETEVAVPTDRTDWEVELAVVIGRSAHLVSEADAWDHVAGITGAQDFSARDVQMTPQGTPQFSLGKSFPGFLPLGPTLVTPDELPDRDAVPLWCEVDGERVQDGCTDDLIFPVAALIAYLSSVVTLRPGDVILTGTPSGVGIGRDPQRFLVPGQVVTTGVGGVGTMRHVMTAPLRPWSWPS